MVRWSNKYLNFFLLFWYHTEMYISKICFRSFSLCVWLCEKDLFSYKNSWLQIPYRFADDSFNLNKKNEKKKRNAEHTAYRLIFSNRIFWFILLVYACNFFLCWVLIIMKCVVLCLAIVYTNCNDKGVNGRLIKTNTPTTTHDSEWDHFFVVSWSNISAFLSRTFHILWCAI